MPDIVMHTYFADKVFRLLDENIKSHITNYDLYSFASAGPDPFFFYNFLNKEENTKVRDMGNVMHKEKTKEFFVLLSKELDNTTDKNEFFSFVCGFVSHYVLDKTIHPYVFHKTGNYIEKTGEGLEYRGHHTRLERALDSFVIRNVYHQNPWKYKIHKQLLTLKSFPENSLSSYSKVLENVYNFQNIKEYAKKSVKDQIKFYKFIFDPFGLKHLLFKLIDKKKIGLDYTTLSYYHKEINDIDIFNKNNALWTNPVDDTLSSTKSVFVLIEEACQECVEIINALYRYSYLKENVDLNEIFKNESYITGLNVEDNREMVFFNKIFLK